MPIKPEPSNIRATCVTCGVRPQASRGNGRYRAICDKCRAEASGPRKHIGPIRSRPSSYFRENRYVKKMVCEAVGCEFVPIHSCQMDIDHIDGNRRNNSIENIQTLCATCHRLKTWQERNHLSKYD